MMQIDSRQSLLYEAQSFDGVTLELSPIRSEAELALSESKVGGNLFVIYPNRGNKRLIKKVKKLTTTRERLKVDIAGAVLNALKLKNKTTR